LVLSRLELKYKNTLLNVVFGVHLNSCAPPLYSKDMLEEMSANGYLGGKFGGHNHAHDKRNAQKQKKARVKAQR